MYEFYVRVARTDNDVFDDFPKISDHFPIYCSKGQTNIPEHFPKISEDFRERPEDVSIIHQRISVQLRQNLISVTSSIYSLVRIWKIYHLSP